LEGLDAKDLLNGHYNWVARERTEEISKVCFCYFTFFARHTTHAHAHHNTSATTPS
jgi:hypothetical protein